MTVIALLGTLAAIANRTIDGLLGRPGTIADQVPAVGNRPDPAVPARRADTPACGFAEYLGLGR